MPRRSDAESGELRRRILGLGPESSRKTHYPSLRQRLSELELFHSMVDQSSDMLLVLDAESGTILDLNATACRRLKAVRTQLVGRSFPDLLEPGVRAHLEAALASCQPAVPADALLESRLTDCLGGSFPVEIAVTYGGGAAGDGRRAVVSARDISVRYASEAALRSSEERYRQLVDQSSDGIFVADGRGRYRDVNPAGCEMLGYSRAELIGLSIADVVVAEERPRIGPEVARLRSGQPVRSEWRFLRKDGSSFCGEVVGRLLPDGRLQGVLRDISERRAVEERLRRAEEQHRIALDAARLGTWRYEAATDLMHLDERARGFIGFAEETVPAAAVFARVHAKDAQPIARAAAAAMDPSSDVDAAKEFRVLAPGGERWLSVHAHARFAGEGQECRAVEVVGTVEDITKRKAVEGQLARLSKAYETLGAINRCVAHAVQEADLLTGACRVAVEHAGFRLARVLVLDEDGAASMAPIHFGPAAGPPERGILVEELFGRYERWHLRMLLAAGGHYCSGSLHEDPFFAPWAKACGDAGINAIGMVPLRMNDRAVFALALYAAEPDCFDAEMRCLVEKMAVDVSFGLERVAESRRVRDAESRLSTVFRYSPSCILITRMSNGRVVDANEAFLATFEYAFEDVIGRHSLESDLWADVGERSSLFRLLESRGRVKDFEAVWHRRSGERRDCLLSGEVVNLGGERHLITMVTDVTERRAIDRMLHAREEEFRALVENSPDVICRFDREGRRVYSNPERCRRFGRDLAELVGKTPTESLPDSPAAGLIEAAVAKVVTEGVEAELELAEREAAGPLGVYRHFRLVPELDAQGHVASVLAIGRDISRLKETERCLRDTQAQLRDLGARREAAREDERKHMAREIHDVLGQLLTALRLEIGMLGMEFGSQEPLLLERTAKATEMVDGTIAIVRNLASALRPSALDMGIVSALEWLAKEFATRAGMECHVAVGDENLDLDEAQAISVFRLVQESLTNIARHARARRATVSLQPAGDDLCLVILDDGVGFDLATADSGKLGLVGMRERALALGGELVVETAPGQGTCIQVHFPSRNQGATS